MSDSERKQYFRQKKGESRAKKQNQKKRRDKEKDAQRKRKIKEKQSQDSVEFDQCVSSPVSRTSKYRQIKEIQNNMPNSATKYALVVKNLYVKEYYKKNV